MQSERLKRQFIDIVEVSKIGILSNFLPLDFCQQISRIPKQTSDRIQVLFVGHLSYAKGYCDLLKSIFQIRDLPFLLTCVGSSIEKENNVFFNQATGRRLIFESPQQVYDSVIVAEQLQHLVRRISTHVEGEAKLQLFAAADIFILPSYSEGFSTAILEAMAAGIPVVATDVGAAAEIIRDFENGFILRPGDVTGIAEKLRLLIQNRELRERMGQANRKLSTSRYMVDQQVQQFYRQIQT